MTTDIGDRITKMREKGLNLEKEATTYTNKLVDMMRECDALSEARDSILAESLNLKASLLNLSADCIRMRADYMDNPDVYDLLTSISSKAGRFEI